MKRFLLAFLLALTCSVCSYAQQGVLPYSLDTNGLPRPAAPSNPIPVLMTGPGGATATLDVVMPSVSSFDSVVADLASPTVKYLQQISSFTAGSSIFFTSSAKVWYFPVSAGVTKTAAQVRLGGLSVDAGGQPPLFILNTTTDIAFVPDVTTASLTVFVGEE